MPNEINEMKKFVNNVKKLVEKKVDNAKTDISKKAIIQSLNEDGTANIIINGEIYNNVKIRPGFQPQINEVVLVCLPNNNSKDMYVDLASATTFEESLHSHSNYSILETITQALIDAWNSAVSHISDTMKHITSSERDLWNTVSNKVDSTEVTTTATPNKILKLDSNSKLPTSITGNADGNAATASKLQTARTISLSGDVTGSTSFDGSANVTISTAVGDNTHNHGNSTITDVDWSKISNKPSSTVANIDDAVNKKHSQNTDNTLTNSSANTINTTGTGNIVDFKVNNITKASIDNAGKFTGTIDWNNVSNKPDPTITLSGDVSGSATMTDLGSVTINTTVADDSHNHVISNIDNLQTELDSKALKSTTITAGSGLTGGGDLSSNRTISHADTSIQASVNNSNGVVIQDVTLDDYGHVTGLGSIDLDSRYYTETEVNNLLSNKSDVFHNHALASLSEKNYTSLVGRPADDDFHMLTELLDSANDDELVIYDVSDSSYKKITRENLLAGLLSSSQFVFIRKKEEFTAAEGQTVFNLTQGSYEVGTGRVDVYIWGNKQPPSAYTETSSTSITLVNGVEAGTKVLIEYIQIANVMDYIHAQNHKIGGSDPITPADIGAASQSHTHVKTDITDFSHTHSISEITNLQISLDGKVNTSDVVTTATANKILKLDSNANLPANITGNASTATKLQTARNISLSGDVTGLASFDGSSNITINATVVDDSHVHDSRYYTKSEIQNNDISMRRLLVNANGVPTSNLGNPTVAEMALFEEQFNNKLAFYDISKFTFEVFDGTTWTDVTSSISTTDKKRLVGGDNTANIIIPNGATKYRITIRNNGSYVYINALYMYWSSNGNSSQIHIWKKRDDGNWVQHTNSSASVSAWPGHLYLPFATIPWSMASTSGHYNDVRIEFTPTWNNANNITLYKLQLWGGYPAGKRNIYSIDENKNVTFPASVTATTFNGDLSGKSASADKLATARTITLTGDVTGSASFDGSANISISATVADDSHNHVISNIDNLQTTLDSKAPLASPAFTGTPTAPTAPNGTNTNQIATTKFVQNALSAGGYGDMMKSQYDTDSDGVVDRAETADKLTTARTISLSGDVTGSVNFDGSNNVSITTTVVNDSHDHTSINYKDTRSINHDGFDYKGVSMHLKYNTTDGLSDGGTYHGVLHLTQWSDISGGKPHQLGFTDNGNIWYRNWNGSAWSSWVKIAKMTDITIPVGTTAPSNPSVGSLWIDTNG